MSRADLLYRETCARILREGVWDTDQSVRPRWADGSPAHTVKCFGVVNRYDLQEEFPLMTLRRTYWRSCVEELLWIWQKKSNNVHDLGSHIWDSWPMRAAPSARPTAISSASNTVSRRESSISRPRAVRPEAQPGQPPHSDKPLQFRRSARDGSVSLRLFHDVPCQRQPAQRHSESALAGHAHGKQLECRAVCRARAHAGAGQRSCRRRARACDRRLPYLRPPHSACRADAGAGAVSRAEFRLDPAVTDFYAFTPDSVQVENYRYHPFSARIPVAI